MHKSCLAALVSTILVSAVACADSLLPPPMDEELARDMFKTLVEINTTHAHGSTAAARAIESWMLTAGFPRADVVFVAPPDHPTKGNVVVRYRGGHAAKPVLFLAHLDVVEARPEDWSTDPFVFTQRDGYFYGRGTIDMKEDRKSVV